MTVFSKNRILKATAKKKRGAQKRNTPRQSGASGFTMGAFSVGNTGVSPGNRQLGVGLQLGFPTGITLKYMLTADQGVVLGLGVGTGWLAQALSLHADYLYHPHIIVRGPPFVLSWYFGGGLGVAVSPRTESYFPIVRYYNGDAGWPARVWIALRAPLGLQLAFRELPIELYIEGVPALVVFPHISFGLGASIGARFYF